MRLYTDMMTPIRPKKAKIETHAMRLYTRYDDRYTLHEVQEPISN